MSGIGGILLNGVLGNRVSNNHLPIAVSETTAPYFIYFGEDNALIRLLGTGNFTSVPVFLAVRKSDTLYLQALNTKLKLHTISLMSNLSC